MPQNTSNLGSCWSSGPLLKKTTSECTWRVYSAGIHGGSSGSLFLSTAWPQTRVQKFQASSLGVNRDSEQAIQFHPRHSIDPHAQRHYNDIAYFYTSGRDGGVVLFSCPGSGPGIK